MDMEGITAWRDVQEAQRVYNLQYYTLEVTTWPLSGSTPALFPGQYSDCAK